MRLTIISTILALFCVGQEDCPDNLSHTNNSVNTVTAYLYEDGEIVDSIECTSAGNSGNINCDLDTIDVDYIALGEPYEDCYYDSDGNIIVDLPVRLNIFEVKVDGTHVDIIWNTHSESNNDYFTVEKSIDGKNWENYCVVQGSGNSAVFNEYSCSDNLRQGVTYYRLTQYDFDGKNEELGIRSSYGDLNVTVVKTVNLVGQEVDENYKGVVIDIFTDSTTRKRYQ